MKKLLTFFAMATLLAACNNTTETEADVKKDSTILLAPESNSNMTDLNVIATDSPKVDSNHINTDTPLAK